MSAFLAGIVFGALFVGAGLVIYITRTRRDEAQRPPYAQPTLEIPTFTPPTPIVRKRKIEL